MKHQLAGFFIFSLLLNNAWAEADGPDHYAVTDVASNDVLNIRNMPLSDARKIGEIPANGDCIQNLGCLWAAKDIYYEPGTKIPCARWCKIKYSGTSGWVAGRYLAESSNQGCYK